MFSMRRVLITYRDGLGNGPRTNQYMIVPVTYLEVATQYITGLWGGRVIETREPHATDNLLLPVGWSRAAEITDYWNKLQLVL